MFLVEIIHILLLLLINILSNWSSLSQLNLVGEVFFIDFLNRLNMSESLAHWINFFWTSITYLAPLFLVLSFKQNIYGLSFSPKWVYLLLVFFFINYLGEIFDSILLSTNWHLLELNKVGVNLLLVNSLNKYHPIIFYWSVISYFFLYSYSVKSSWSLTLYLHSRLLVSFSKKSMQLLI